MTAKAVRVTRIPDKRPVRTPRRPDGIRYRFELIEPRQNWRAYADECTALMAELVSGYEDADPAQRVQVRQGLAIQAQVLSQATLVAEWGTDSCSEAEQAVLMTDRDTPPQPGDWCAPLPLLLVEDFYEPTGDLPRPTTSGPGEILWIDARDDEALLRSLHQLGWLVLGEVRPSVASH